jgi:hypothetical protein
LLQEEWIEKLHSLAEGLGAQCTEALSHLSPTEEDLKHFEYELRRLIFNLKERTERMPRLNLDYAVRPKGADHQWGKDPLK